MKTILTVVLALVAGQTQALSCRFGDAAVAYNQALGDEGRVIAAIGSLDWSNAEVALIHGGLQMDYEGQFYDLPLHFTGEVIDANGVRTPIDAPVRVLSHCINGDCGYAGEGEVLTFLHDINGELVMYAGPCQSYPRAPAPEAVALVQQCVDDGQCEGGWEY